MRSRGWRAHERRKLALDEDALAVVGIDVVAGRLAVQLEHDVAFFHARDGAPAQRDE